MKSEDAKAIFLLEYCAEECGDYGGYQEDWVCENCEINAAIKALDKQIPKKPKIDREFEVLGMIHEIYLCPSCGAMLDNEDYCMSCGQALGWQEVEE